MLLNNTTSDPTDFAYEVYRAVSYTSIGFVSGSLNLLFASLFHENLKGEDFRWPLLSIAVIDILSCCVAILQHVLLPYMLNLCLFSTALYVCFIVSVVHAPLPTVVSRYFQVCQPKIADSFNKFGKVLLILYPYILGFSQFAYYVSRKHRKVPGNVSYGNCPPYEPDPLSAYIMLYSVVTQFLFYVFLLFCTWKLRKKLKFLRSTQENLGIAEKVKKTSFLLRASLIQAMAPIFLQIPLTLVTILLPPSPVVTKWAFVVALSVFQLGTVTDALATIIIVVPYRKTALSYYRKLRGKIRPTSNQPTSSQVVSVVSGSTQRTQGTPATTNRSVVRREQRLIPTSSRVHNQTHF